MVLASSFSESPDEMLEYYIQVKKNNTTLIYNTAITLFSTLLGTVIYGLFAC
jgi:hypothetical protein